MSNPPVLHENCTGLAPLLGTWKGSGQGHYPTISAFEYLEELTFAHVGKPFLSMQQRTRDASTSAPLHAEYGYLRGVEPGVFELVVAQPSGILEIDAVDVSVTSGGVELNIESVEVPSTSSAKAVSGVRRRIVVDGDEMVSEMWMAAMGEPMTHHLRSSLTRS